MIVTLHLLFSVIHRFAKIMSGSWTKEQLDKYNVTFEKADEQKRGWLTYSSVVAILRTNGFKGSHEELKAIFRQTDANKDNKISKDEFKTCMEAIPTYDHQEIAMRKAFEILDADKSGFLTRTELMDATKDDAKIDVEAEKIADLLVYLAKEDDDGKIQFEEFLRVWGNYKVANNMMGVFKTLDTDNSGFLTKEELIAAVKADSELNIRACKISDLLIYWVKDADKKIEYAEFVKVYQEQPADKKK